MTAISTRLVWSVSRGNQLKKMSQQSVHLLMGTVLWITSCLLVSQCVSLETQKTYYDTLDVQSTATDRQIQKAFHRLAVKFHPDKNKSSEAEKIFREIVEAYEVLSDQESRRTYDHLGHEAFLQDEKDFHHREEGPEEAFFHFDFDEFFSSLDLDDDDLFMDEHHRHSWGFPTDVEDMEDMEDLEEDQHLLDHIFFDTREQHYYYGPEDEDESEHFH
ncbi:unnamed protein product [Lota lota]